MAYQKKQYRRRRKSAFPSWLLVLLIIGGALLYINFQNQAAADPATNLEIPTLVSAAGDPWWSSDYAYRQQLDFDRPAGKLLEVKVDHSTLVLAGQSRPDASDLRVVAQIDDATELVPLIVSSPNTSSTLVTFDGSKYDSAAYYLYYGNLRGDLPSTLPIPSTQMANGTKQATPGSIQTPTIKLTATKKWNLIKRDTAEVEISLHSEVGSVDENTQFYFATTGTDKLRAVEGLGIGNMEDYILQITGLNPGMKGLYFVIKSGGDTYRTNTVYFLLSRPVYVAWTIDWEGYNVQDWVLLAMNNIADKYQMPLTQFFNPRLYIDAQTPDYRRGEITDWLRSRLQNKGDEFSMHMHMQYDMIRAAGLEPVTSPRWGSGLDGYDVLTSDYDYTQFKQILSWGLQTFAEQGLPTPVGYRAGGWFADLDNLRALADLGFAYD
ncbi:hypothetical protein KC640_03825, partial [Candidatus Dojkabacteria bacterium]|nr:hypothetical protein [Candidatus Dojkabacteria bacterium]